MTYGWYGWKMQDVDDNVPMHEWGNTIGNDTNWGRVADMHMQIIIILPFLISTSQSA